MCLIKKRGCSWEFRINIGINILYANFNIKKNEIKMKFDRLY